MDNRETVPCRICGKPTPMLGTKLCDWCYELETRVQRNPDLALKILADLNKSSGKVEKKLVMKGPKNKYVTPGQGWTENINKAELYDLDYPNLCDDFGKITFVAVEVTTRTEVREV